MILISRINNKGLEMVEKRIAQDNESCCKKFVITASRTSRSSENSRFPYVFHRLVVSCKFCSICFATFVQQI
jgi:hypothetical protein